MKEHPRSALEMAQAKLDHLMETTRAASCTFYVRDPWWPDEFRLLLMPGVQFKEPMHGFMYPSGVKNRISKGPNLEFIENSFADTSLHDHLDPMVEELAAENKLFSGFVQRESVGSCIKVLSHEERILQAFLFVNFSQSQSSDQSLLDLAKQCLAELTPSLPSLRAEVCEEAGELGRQLIRLIKPTNLLIDNRSHAAGSNGMLEAYFDALLDAVLAAFDIPPESGFASLLLYDSSNGRLKREAAQGLPIKPPNEQRAGEGIASWVALKRRALLIEDIRTSPYQTIYQDAHEDIRSELAVPMLAGDRIVGVLNVESIEPGYFKPGAVRALWYAANQAAIAFRLSQSVTHNFTLKERTQKLLEVCHDATTEGGDSECEHLKELSSLIAQWARSSDCQIWSFDENAGQYRNVCRPEQTTDSSSGPRVDGWSTRVIASSQIVWISDIENRSDYQVHEWNDTTERWQSTFDHEPLELNDQVVQLRFTNQLGIPIHHDKSAPAVAWLRYKDGANDPPDTETMRNVRGLAASTGMVMDFLRRRDESLRTGAEELAEKDIAAFRESIFPDDSMEIEGLQLHVTCRPHHSPIGGDWYVLSKLDETGRRIGVFLGDAAGHGISAALKMLPILATFHVFSRRTSSTKFVLERMNELTKGLLGYCASAIYFILDLNGDKPSICASSAGHPSLIILDKEGRNRDFPERGAGFGRTLLGVADQVPMGEAFAQLEYGETIIAFTDGISEADASAREADDVAFFERRGMLAAALQHVNSDAKTMANAIMDAATKHAGGELDDDATVLVIKLDPATKPEK